jgi:hypothetical protein
MEMHRKTHVSAGAVVGGVILLGGVSMVIFYVWHVKTK